MRAILGFATVAALVGLETHAQDALSFSFDGRVGLGYLSQTTADADVDGFQYKGPVFRIEGTGRVEAQLLEPLIVGALARVSWQKGTDSNYDVLDDGTVRPGVGKKFGGTELDVAVYAAMPNVSLSYGEMESAFDLATLEVGQGASVLDGGNAVWMNVGDGAGSTGYRGEVSTGPGQGIDYKTLRLDVLLGDLTFSASKSKGSFGSAEYSVNAAGLLWKHDFAGTEVSLGAGYDKGPDDKFRSLSLGVKSQGLSIVVSKIRRSPLVINSRDTAAFDITYFGQSVSYDFGSLTTGISLSRQGALPGAPTLFEGNALALWASWDARENVTIDFEVSKNDYPGGGDSTRKASIAVAMEF